MHDHDTRSQRNIKTALLLNVCFTVIELIGGLLTNSLAILADALHDLGDSLVLGLALYAEKKSEKGPDTKRTFGYARLSVFSALASGAVLIGGSLFIISAAIPRLLHPQTVNAPGMMILAVVGIFFNTLGALRLRRGKGMNEKVLSWHLFEDVFGWTAVLIGGGLIYLLDMPIIDPILTIGFTVFILWGVVRSMREVANILLQGVPAHINIEAAKTSVLAIPGITGVHDMHIWSLDGKNDIFSGHIVVDSTLLQTDRLEETKKKIKETLHAHHIEHSTIELENKEYCSGIDCEEETR